MPSQHPVPCMSGGPDMATMCECDSNSARAWRTGSAGSVIGGCPIIGGYDCRKNSVNSPSGYITPLGIPVVPPV